MTSSPCVIRSAPIERFAYQPYGDLIAADETRPFTSTNFGKAKRFDYLSDVSNLRPAGAKLNLCVFQCQGVDLPLEIGLLERHSYSSQVFLPIGGNAKFLVIVCLGEERPDLSTLRAFRVLGGQGISYKPGVWHYPIMALEQPLDFSCLVFEDGSAADCQVLNLDQPVTVEA